MKQKIRELKRMLWANDLMREALLIEQLAKGSTLDSDPYNSIGSPMDPVEWFDEECSHETSQDPCPVCGKKVEDA
jgi:hypothetical protein